MKEDKKISSQMKDDPQDIVIGPLLFCNRFFFAYCIYTYFAQHLLLKIKSSRCKTGTYKLCNYKHYTFVFQVIIIRIN